MSFYETIWESDEDEQPDIEDYELNGELMDERLTIANNLEGGIKDELQTTKRLFNVPGVDSDSLESILSGPSEFSNISSTLSPLPLASSPISVFHPEHRDIPQYEPGDLVRYTRKRPRLKASSKSTTGEAGAALATGLSRLTLSALRTHPMYTTAAMLPLTRCVRPDAQRLATLLRYRAIPRPDMLAAHVDADYVDLSLLPVHRSTEDTDGSSRTRLVSGVSNAAEVRLVLLLDSPVDAMRWASAWSARRVDRNRDHDPGVGSGSESIVPSVAGHAATCGTAPNARSAPRLPTLPTLLPTALCTHLAVELAYHVVARTDVCVLRSDAQWLKHGRRVRPTEEHAPYRVVERTARRLPSTLHSHHAQLGHDGLHGDCAQVQPLEPGRVRVSLFGEWQTDTMHALASDAGVSVDVAQGHAAAAITATTATCRPTSPPVPVNRFGNVDLSNNGQLPPGTEHVPAETAAEACTALGIPHAPAVTGWRSCPAPGMHSVEPVVCGVVVWAVDAPTLRAALEELATRASARRRVTEWVGAVRGWGQLARAVAGRRKAFVDAARSRR